MSQTALGDCTRREDRLDHLPDWVAGISIGAINAVQFNNFRDFPALRSVVMELRLHFHILR
jgi:hypothetical protein